MDGSIISTQMNRTHSYETNKISHLLTIIWTGHQLCGIGQVFARKPNSGATHWDRFASREEASIHHGHPARHASYSFFLQLFEVVLNYFFTLEQVEGTRACLGLKNKIIT